MRTGLLVSTVLVCILAAAFSGTAQAALLLQDDFESYTDGTQLNGAVAPTGQTWTNTTGGWPVGNAARAENTLGIGSGMGAGHGEDYYGGGSTHLGSNIPIGTQTGVLTAEFDLECGLGADWARAGFGTVTDSPTTGGNTIELVLNADGLVQLDLRPFGGINNTVFGGGWTESARNSYQVHITLSVDIDNQTISAAGTDRNSSASFSSGPFAIPDQYNPIVFGMYMGGYYDTNPASNRGCGIDNIWIGDREASDCNEVWEFGLGIPADLSNNCDVYFEDVALLGAEWAECSVPGCVYTPAECDAIWAAEAGMETDLNQDCIVNGKDYNILAANWMRCNDPNIWGCELYNPSRPENLALGKSYTLYPDPPTYDDTSDPGDTTQLTDGATTYLSPWDFHTRLSTVGWQNDAGDPQASCSITFDLGHDATLTNIRYYTAVNEDIGISEPNIEIYVRPDGGSWSLAGNRAAGSQGTYPYSLFVDIPMTGVVVARDVLILATPPLPYSVILVDEIEIQGNYTPIPD